MIGKGSYPVPVTGLVISLLSRGQLLKERICFIRVDTVSKRYLIQRSKQEFLKVNTCITLFSEKKQWAFIRAGAFIGINMVYY